MYAKSLGAAENDVRGPFALHDGPIVVQGKGTEDLVVSRIELLGEVVENPWP